MIPKMKVVEPFLPCWFPSALKKKSVCNNPSSVQSNIRPVGEVAGLFAKVDRLKTEAEKLLLGGPHWK